MLKEPERRAQSQPCMWLVKSGEDGLLPIILFGYTETKAKYHIERFLEGYGGGYLETDGYQGYNNLKISGAVVSGPMSGDISWMPSQRESRIT